MMKNREEILRYFPQNIYNLLNDTMSKRREFTRNKNKMQKTNNIKVKTS